VYSKLPVTVTDKGIKMKKITSSPIAVYLLVLLASTLCLCPAVKAQTVYQPTEASIATHPLPQWYQDAKLGIFIHWGLYAVPGWAKGTTKPLADIMKSSAGEEWFANNPYAEWYWNSLKIKGSSTEKHQVETYGKDFTRRNGQLYLKTSVQDTWYLPPNTMMVFYCGPLPPRILLSATIMQTGT
jgi:hypothetical protein